MFIDHDERHLDQAL